MDKFSLSLSSFRFKEIFLMTGFSIIGLFFATDRLQLEVIPELLLFSLSIFSLFASIYSINSWYGYTSDIQNNRMSYLQKVSPRQYIVFTTLSLPISLLLLIYLRGWELGLLGLICFTFWMIYSAPKGLKSSPLLGTLLHFFMQILHFHIGFLLHKSFSSFSLLVSIYFSILFAAGHLNHELIDYRTDKESGTKTTAVRIGEAKVSLLSTIFFAAAMLYLIILGSQKIVSPIMVIPFVVAAILQFILKFCLQLSPIQYRTMYRIFYLIAGIIYLFGKYFRMPIGS